MIIVKGINGFKIKYRGDIEISFDDIDNTMVSVKAQWSYGCPLNDMIQCDLFYKSEIESIEGVDENGR
jgi:hypothetical protein